MTKFAGPAVLVLGVLLIVIGAALQASGAAAVVFCSAIGTGMILAVAGGVVWIVQALTHRGSPRPAAS